MSTPIRWIASVVALLIVAAGLTVTVLSRVGVQEHPPCHACVQPTIELPQVSVCELVADRQKLTGRVVRVNAKFQNDAGQLSLEDGGCNMIVGFAKERQACQGAWRKLQVVCGVGTWYDGSGSVRVIGSISTVPAGNYSAGDVGFTISCLEEVRTKPVLGQRVRFAVGRLLHQGSPR